MRCLVFTHKAFHWSETAQTYLTDGGFPRQMEALAALFDTLYIAFPQSTSQEGPSAGAPIRASNVQFIPLPWRGGTSRTAILWNHIRLMPRYFRLFRMVDVVHCPLPSHVGIIPMMWALVLRKPLWVRYCGDFRRPKTTVQRALIRLMKATAHWPNVRYVATGWEDEPPHPHIPWVFATALTEDEIRQRTHCAAPPHSPPTVLWVGRLEPGKGVGELVDLIRAAEQARIALRWRVIGDGSLRPTLESLHRQGKVEWTPYLPHALLMEAFCRADLFLFTSQSEGFPKVIVEAMAAGLPIMAHPIGPLPRLRREGAAIHWLRPSVDEMVRQMAAIFTDSHYLEQAQRNHRMARRFSLELWGKAMERSLRNSR